MTAGLLESGFSQNESCRMYFETRTLLLIPAFLALAGTAAPAQPMRSFPGRLAVLRAGDD